MTTGKWLVPDNINPPESVCVQIQVPNDMKHIAAFWGALNELALAWNWEDSFQDGSTVAYLWRDILETAIEAVRNGVNCQMPIDCNDVEACLATSAIIANLQAQITSNDNDISSLDGRQTQSEGDISQLQLDVADNLLSIQQHNLTLNDHETRITALEQSGGGGGAYINKTVQIKEFIDIYVADGTTQEFLLNIPAGFDGITIEIIAEPTSGSPAIYLEFNSDTNQGNYRTDRLTSTWANGSTIGFLFANKPMVESIYIAKPDGSQEKIAHSTNSQVSSANAPTRNGFTVNWTQSDPLTTVALKIAGSNFAVGTVMAAYGHRDIVIPTVGQSDPLVTFDAGGYPYTIDQSDPLNIAYVGSGGNPDNCMRFENPQVGEVAELTIDLGQARDISGLQFDFNNLDSNVCSWQLLVDNVLTDNATSNSAGAGIWETVIRPLSVNGQVLKLQISNFNVGVNGLRTDNVLVELL